MENMAVVDRRGVAGSRCLAVLEKHPELGKYTYSGIVKIIKRLEQARMKVQE